MHTCKTCGSCMNLDMNLAYLTDPPQYKCKESGRLHFQSDVCDLSADTNIVNIEYIRKEDAKSVTWRQPSYTDPLNVLTEVRERIDSIKPADVVPVVRCKDCKQFRRWVDTDIEFCDLTESTVFGDDFCSRGERIEE